MPLVKTDGIILKRIRLGETSKILTVLSPTRGKIKLVAKGARKPRHRFGSSMEPFTVCSIVFYHKEGRDLEMLSQCDTTQGFLQFSGDIRRFAYGSGILELADKVVLGRESTDEVYARVIEAVVLMADAQSSDLPLIWWAYQLKLLGALGYRPELEHCDRCGKPVAGKRVLFSPAAGGVRCQVCRAEGEFEISGGSLRALQFLSDAPWDEIRSLRVSKRQAGEVESLLSKFFVRQYGESLRIKSLRILGSIPRANRLQEDGGEFPNDDHAAGGVLG